MRETHIDVRAFGPFACFSRPEFKAERVSYPIITPSAACGLLEALFWKPEFRWEISEIRVLRPIKQFALLRNEISERQGSHPIVVEQKRQQRASLILRDVDYVIRARLVLAPHATDPLLKYSEQFQRRLARGQVHHTPYFGTREFAAAVAAPDGTEEPYPIDEDLGPMLFGMAFVESAERQELTFRRHDHRGARSAAGYAQALYFPARIERGVLRVPRELYDRRRELEGGAHAVGAP